MNMNFLNPYSYIGGAIILALIGGGFYYQGTQIHHWHTQYTTEHDKNTRLELRIKDLTDTQNKQTDTTQGNVIKVIQGPKEVSTIIKEIHDTPDETECVTPKLPQDVKDAY